jgi:hypothetical protein
MTLKEERHRLDGLRRALLEAREHALALLLTYHAEEGDEKLTDKAMQIMHATTEAINHVDDLLINWDNRAEPI